jgi:WD40 repeat protein
MMPTNKRPKEAFELYSRLPDASGSKPICAQDWLINNGERYTHTATALAYSAEAAYGALQEKRAGHGRTARFATVHQPPFLQMLGPGDVLIGEEKAWMLQADERLEQIGYDASHPWRSYSQSQQINGIAWSPDGAYLAAGGSGSQVYLHAVTGGTKKPWSIPSYHRHKNWTVYGVAWSPDGTHLASGGYEDEVHLWRPNYAGGYEGAAKGSIVICRVEGIRESIIKCLVWAPDSSSIFAGRSDGGIVQWHAATGEFLFHSTRHQQEVTDLALSTNDTMTFASASKDTTVRIWQLSDPPESDLVYRGHTNEVLAVAWSPDGTRVVSGGKKDRHLHVWNPLTGEVFQRIPLSISFPEPLSIISVAWSPTGHLIAAGCDDGTLQLIDVQQMRHIISYRTTNSSGVNSVAWSPDGWVIASGGYQRWGNNHAVEIWPAGMDRVGLR